MPEEVIALLLERGRPAQRRRWVDVERYARVVWGRWVAEPQLTRRTLAAEAGVSLVRIAHIEDAALGILRGVLRQREARASWGDRARWLPVRLRTAIYGSE